MSPSHAFGRLSIVSCRTAASFFIKEGWGKKKDKGTQLVRSRLEALLRNRCVFRCMHNTSLHERQWRHDRHQWNVQPARRNSVRFSSAGILETRRNRPRRGTSVNVNHACATFEEWQTKLSHPLLRPLLLGKEKPCGGCCRPCWLRLDTPAYGLKGSVPAGTDVQTKQHIPHRHLSASTHTVKPYTYTLTHPYIHIWTCRG